MTRSVWKGPFVDGFILKKAEVARNSGRKEVIKIWSRRSTILPQFVGLTFGVYNGQKHIPVMVTEDMIGHKFGEFSPTRIFHGHSGDRKSKVSERLGSTGVAKVGKPARKRALSDTQANAVARGIRVSPRKLNLVAQSIRGKKVRSRSPT